MPRFDIFLNLVCILYMFPIVFVCDLSDCSELELSACQCPDCFER